MPSLTIKGTRLAQVAGNINRATERLGDGTSRIASGNRISKASDDVASLSVGTQLKTITVSLRQALINAAQATSMIQVMDDAYGQIQSMLERMQALAVQSNSGSLTGRERGFLNQEFSNLMGEINRVTQSTSFNGQAVLSPENVTTETLHTSTALADEAKASLVFSQKPTNNQTLRIQNVIFRFRNTPVPSNPNDIKIGATIQDTVANIAAKLSQSDNPNISEARYEANGDTLVIIHRSRGQQAQNFTIDEQGSSSRNRFITVGGIDIHTSGQHRYILGGGSGDGLGMNSVQAHGDIGDSLVTDQNQTTGEVVFQVNNSTNGINNNQQLRIDDGFNGTANFVFRNVANPNNPFHIQKGATNEETLQNAVKVMTEYVEKTTNKRMYGVRQLEFEADGLRLIMRSTSPGNPKDIYNNNLAFAETTSGGFLSATSMANGNNSGVNVSGVVNQDFYGSISGFSTRYQSQNVLTASITVGAHQYTADIEDTNPAADTSVRFMSNEGGYFDVLMAGGNGMEVSDQQDAELFAARLNAAFDSLTFTQTRKIDSFHAIGTVANISWFIQDNNFDSKSISDFSAYEDPTQPGELRFEVVVNGTTYRSTKDIGTVIDPYEKIVLYSADNTQQQLTFEHGSLSLDLTDSVSLETFVNDMKSSFGISGEPTVYSFQVGKRVENTIDIELKSFSLTQVFDNPNLNIRTQEAAEEAFQAVDAAIDQVMSERADLGATQSRFDYASRNISSSLLNQQHALSELLDTDLPTEMTQYMVDTVLSQAGISTLAQATALREGLVTTLLNNLA